MDESKLVDFANWLVTQGVLIVWAPLPLVKVAVLSPMEFNELVEEYVNGVI